MLKIKVLSHLKYILDINFPKQDFEIDVTMARETQT